MAQSGTQVKGGRNDGRTEANHENAQRYAAVALSFHDEAPASHPRRPCPHHRTGSRSKAADGSAQRRADVRPGTPRRIALMRFGTLYSDNDLKACAWLRELVKAG